MADFQLFIKYVELLYCAKKSRFTCPCTILVGTVDCDKNESSMNFVSTGFNSSKDFRMNKSAQMNIKVNPLFRDACNIAAEQDGVSLNVYVEKLLAEDLENRGIQINVSAQVEEDPRKLAEYRKLMQQFVGPEGGKTIFSNQKEVSQAEYEKTVSEFTEHAKSGNKLFQP